MPASSNPDFVNPADLNTRQYPEVTPTDFLERPVDDWAHLPLTLDHMQSINQFMERLYRLYRSQGADIEMDDTGVAKIGETGQALFDTDENDAVMDFWQNTTTLYQVTAASRLTDDHTLDLSVPAAPELRGVDNTPVYDIEVKYRPPDDLLVSCEYRIIADAPKSFRLFDATIEEWNQELTASWWGGLYEHILETLTDIGSYSRATAAGFAYCFFPPLRKRAADEIYDMKSRGQSVSRPTDDSIREDIEYILQNGITQ